MVRHQVCDSRDRNRHHLRSGYPLMKRLKLIGATLLVVGMSVVFLAAQGVSLPSPSYRILYTGADPEGVIAKPIGWIAIRTDNGTIYSKTTGTGNTGWTALAAGSGIATTDIDTCAELAAIMTGET